MLGAVAHRVSLCMGLARCLRPVVPRVISACPQHTSRGQGSQKQPLKQWALSVSPFTSVRAQLASCSISVTPLDPHAFPEADRAFITVHGVSKGPKTALDHCHVHYDEERRELKITRGEGNGELSIDLEAPIKSNLFITTQGRGHVRISKMECDFCKVATQEGNCTLHSVKEVDVKKLQGTTMNVSTEHGSLKVKAIYAESSSISSHTGKIELGHVHGNATVKNESGDTIIDGSNSFMQVSSHSGDIDLYVGDGGSAHVFSEQGAVCVRVPSSLRAGVELCGASVDISPEVMFHETGKHQAPGQTTVMGFVNGESQTEQSHLSAQTKTGSVTLKTQSWFESLKLRS
ncbi:protein FAM185A isoform X2 [Boleophthalmus pectinirostris]|uniref:protein FAM185A isoform X2 n=1 Tax=Boleophthalmus pectinirostris TaxID=150288 RepID=UPI00242BD90C|nr:protein FAM185A isoform X2 [Boleophthalmus pectinirostris]